MAKKKGATLSDLNEFLKKDPNSLADVDKLSEEASRDVSETIDISIESVVSMIQKISIKDKESQSRTLLKVILKTLEEKGDESSADILLTNMALYLQHAENTGEKLNELLKS